MAMFTELVCSSENPTILDERCRHTTGCATINQQDPKADEPGLTSFQRSKILFRASIPGERVQYDVVSDAHGSVCPEESFPSCIKAIIL